MNAVFPAAAVAVVSLTAALAGCSPDPTATAMAPVRVGVAEFAELIERPGILIVDVRTPEEFAGGHIRGAVNIPLSGPDFAAQIAQLEPAASYAVYCRSGNRSQPAVDEMTEAGISSVYELKDGTAGWAAAGQPLVV
jgi:phage shock protein E